MAPRLPPPDPHESLGMEPPDGLSVGDPTAVFLTDKPSDLADRLSDAFLRLRPGVLIIVAPV